MYHHEELFELAVSLTFTRLLEPTAFIYFQICW